MLLCDVYQCSVNNISNLLSYVTVRRHDEEEKNVDLIENEMKFYDCIKK